MMRALTLREPVPTLIALGAKTIVMRKAPTEYRGLIAIHATKADHPTLLDDVRYAIRELMITGHRATRQSRDIVDRHWKGLFGHQGHILAIAELVDCRTVHAGPTVKEHLFHFLEKTDDCGWLLRDVALLPRPIPYAGSNTFWTVDKITERKIKRQLAHRRDSR